MSDNETKALIFSIGNTKREFLDKLLGWNRYIPVIQQDLEFQEWMEHAAEKEPDVLSPYIDENFRYVLQATQQTLPGLLNIPSAPENFEIYPSTSGTILPTQYYRYMDNIGNNVGEAFILNWVDENKKSYKKIRDAHNTSAEVAKRLAKLNPELGELHGSASEAVLRCAAKVIEPPLAAADPRRLLEQFKGHLIVRCRSGQKTTYKRIADNLAADSEMTKAAIEGEQATYDKIWDEFTHILKRIKPVDHDYLPELFAQLEDHIMIVTSAIDPKKIGINLISEQAS
jgi:hypothetical protein